MRVLLELNKLKDPNSGLGQFCAHLGNAVVEARPEHADLTAYLPKENLGFLGPAVQYQVPTPLHNLFSPEPLCDIWHNTHQDSPYWPASGTTSTLLTIHDLNFLENPEYSPAKKAHRLRRLQRQVDRADALVAISEFTASRVRRHLDTASKPLYKIPNGCPPLVSKEQQEPILAITRPFVLALGVVHPKKNWHVLLPLIKQLPEVCLVIAGSYQHKYATAIRSQIKELSLERQVLMTGAVTEAQKAWLLRTSEALWFPSLSEGFGIPPIEAMSVGKPVFLSTHTSLPEIGGDVAYYWDSFEPEYMARVYSQSMKNFNNSEGMPDVLRQRAALFSWKKAAKSYWDIYASLYRR